MKAHRAVADLAFDFGTGHESGDRVDDDDVDGSGAHKHVADLKRVLAGVGLGDEHFVDVDAQAGGIARVEGVLGVDERHDAAHGLGLGENLQRQRRLTARLRAVNLDNAAARNTADAKRCVERQGTGGNGLHRQGVGRVAELHDGSLAEALLNLARRELDHLGALVALGTGVNLLGD